MRSVIKIAIQQELMAIQDDAEYIPFLVNDSSGLLVADKDANPHERMTFKRELFKVFQVEEPAKGELREYLL